MNNESWLCVENISKHFGDVQALNDVSLDFRRGEVLALVGENGAGKSTLMRLLEGVFPPSRGRIEIEGGICDFEGPRDAHNAGIRVIHQEPEIVPHMSVGENIFIGSLPHHFGAFLDQSHLAHITQDLLDKFQMSDELSPLQMCEGLGPAQRQLIEIMRAVHAGGKLIAFDEPTSSLTDEEARRLFEIINQLRSQGVAVVYISHRLTEITELADRIAILRDGHMIDVLPAKGITKEEITRLMVGRPLSDLFPEKNTSQGKVVLEVDRMSTDFVSDISFKLNEGEVLGIGGLMGAGRSELAKGIFGFHQRKSGRVLVSGKELPSGNTAAAIQNGIGFAPEDRKDEALLLLQSILDNAVICVPEQVSQNGFFSRSKALELIGKVSSQMSLKAASLDAPVTSLSGGNQQKVVLTRWLSRDLKVLILDEPTRGIDVGAKAEIYELIHQLTRQGLGVIIISSEMPELLGLSHRILVMNDGEVRAELVGESATEEAILTAAIPHGTTSHNHPSADYGGAGQ